MKLSRIKKLSVRLIAVYFVIVCLVFFAEPFKTDHYIYLLIPGLFLISLGEFIRVWACGHLEKNQKITNDGPYAHVKNPLYLGTFLIMVGFCLIGESTQHWNWYLLGAGLLVFLAYYAPKKKQREYDRMREKFGEPWTQFENAVPDYIPRLTPYEGRSGEKFRLALVFENSEQWTFLAVVAGLVLVLMAPQVQKFIAPWFGG